jgi:hypothetical protein
MLKKLRVKTDFPNYQLTNLWKCHILATIYNYVVDMPRHEVYVLVETSKPK